MSNDATRGRRAGKLTIAISGKSGCGNSTVSRLVAGLLGLRVVNYTFKDLARDRGLTFDELARRAESDPQYDLTIDKMQVKLAEEGGCVLGSRLAIWLLRDSAFTVYLDAPLAVRAARIAQREGKDPATALRETAERDTRDHDRYARLYGYEVNDFSFASLVVETESIEADEVARRIVESAAGARA
jgi:CMP/dCMP kinase